MNWNPFTRKNDKSQSNAEAAQANSANASGSTEGKGRPTPKRRDAQNARLTPLVPKDRKAQRKAAQERRREKENLEYEAMRTGDVRNMPKSEQLPWRMYIRDYVDARHNLGEFFMPIAVVMMIISVIVTYFSALASFIILVLMYVYFLVIIVDCWFLWRDLKKKLIAKYGERSVSRGMRSSYYAWSRAIQVRRWRLPAPRHKSYGNWPS